MAVATAALAFGIALGGTAAAEVQMLDDFESYVDTDELRLTWLFVGDPTANLHLQCGYADCGGDPWCAESNGHSALGLANEGCKYMRLVFQAEGVTRAQYMIGGANWSGLERIRFFYRGRLASFVDDPCSMQAILTGNGGTAVANGPVVEQVQCEFAEATPGCGFYCCPWREYVIDVTDWEGLVSLDMIEIVVTTTGGQGHVYIDAVKQEGEMPTAVDETSWGRIKALYRQ
jgi:hypothetical protein